MSLQTRVSGLGVGFLLAATVVAADAGKSVPALVADIEANYRANLQAESVVGSSLLVLANGKPVTNYFYGLADKANHRKVDRKTIFHWASVTKTFTAIGIMQLVERGIVSLDDAAVSYLPELHQLHNPFGDMNGITLRHLLSHSSGLRGPTWPWGGEEDWHPHEPTSWDQIVAMLPYTEIAFEPGSRFGYSNLGFVILGRIVEILSGDDIEVYLDKNVLKPLGMHRSYFDATPWHLRRWRTHGYYCEDGDIKDIGAEFDTGITAANGGLNAPVPDMALFVNFLAGVGEGEFSGEVLGRDTLLSMFEPLHVVARAESRTVWVGLGFFVVDHLVPGTDRSIRWVGHSGYQLTHRSFIYIQPSRGLAAIAASNSVNRTLGNPSERRLRARLLNELFPALTSESLPAIKEDR